jgi:uncharacterized protein
MRIRITGLVIAVQAVLLLAHWFVYSTWNAFRPEADPPGSPWLRVAVLALSFSFVAASLLAFRYSHFAVKLLYRIASVWAGLLNFFLLAACLCWVLYLTGRLAGVDLRQPGVSNAAFGLALLTGLYGLVNARLLRVERIQVKLRNLPASWRGRVAALVSDVHLGHVNGGRFMRRIVGRLARLQPDIVFVTGDLYDGTRINAGAVVESWKEFRPALGSYFVTGNHEEFSDPSTYLDAVSGVGVCALRDEKVTVDGIEIVGVHYGASTRPENLRVVLRRAALDPDRPSILLSHAPHALEVAESEGVSLQLSGHTHAGQIFPFTWLTRRIFREFTYGLARLGSLMVYTSSGAGTWGPPMRVGSRPEIALIEFV